MDEILKYCIKVNGVTSYYPLYEETSHQPIESRPDMAMKYGWNNGTVAFVTPDGSYYVTPYCFEVANKLEELGYEDVGLYVPFSNGDVPSDKALASKWEDLCNGARKVHEEREIQRRKERYARYAEQKGLSALPQEIYDLCIEIPQEGLKTVHFIYEESITRPVEDYNMERSMGTYCQNNGKVCFVDDKGNTYVTPFCTETRNALAEAGYRESGLFVPLSNGEVPTDPLLAQRWDELCEESRKAFNIREEARKAERIKQIAEEKHLKELPEEAYKLSLAIPENGLETTWMGRKPERTQPIYDWELPKVMGTFCYNNGKVSFIDSEGKYYVSPFNHEVEEMLRAAGYQERSLYVPLSNGEEITDPILADRWQNLCIGARKAFDMREKERQAARRMQIAAAKRLKRLPAEVYNMCITVPDEGLETTWMGTPFDTATPIPDWQLEKCMGTYCFNNGITTFVDEEGKSLVTPFYRDIIDYLIEAGYTEGSLFVPLSNGEQIVDPVLKTKWESLITEEREKSASYEQAQRKVKYKQISTEKGISSLPNEVYEMSLPIPDDGLETTWFGSEPSKTVPIYDWQMGDAIGTYYQNNGIIAFVDKNGKLFVSPFSNEVYSLLVEAGYTEGSLFVPLSNGEEIVDPKLAARWEILLEESRKLSGGNGLKF